MERAGPTQTSGLTRRLISVSVRFGEHEPLGPLSLIVLAGRLAEPPGALRA